MVSLLHLLLSVHFLDSDPKSNYTAEVDLNSVSFHSINSLPYFLHLLSDLLG